MNLPATKWNFLTRWQVKPPSQNARKYDVFTELAVMPTPEAFPPPALFGCPLVPS